MCKSKLNKLKTGKFDLAYETALEGSGYGLYDKNGKKVDFSVLNGHGRAGKQSKIPDG